MRTVSPTMHAPLPQMPSSPTMHTSRHEAPQPPHMPPLPRTPPPNIPPDRILDTRLWKHYLSATLFADGKMFKDVLRTEIPASTSTRRWLYLVGVSLDRFRWRYTQAPGGWRALVRPARTLSPALCSGRHSLCMYRTNSTTRTNKRNSQKQCNVPMCEKQSNHLNTNNYLLRKNTFFIASEG